MISSWSATISPGKWKKIQPPDSLTITNAALSSKRPSLEDAGPDPRGCLEVSRDPAQQKEHGTIASFAPLVCEQVPLQFRIVAKQECWIRVKGPFEIDLLGHTYPQGTRDPLEMFANSITIRPSSGKNTDSGASLAAPAKIESAKPAKKASSSASASKRKYSESSNAQEKRSQPLSRKKTRSMASVAGTEGSGYAPSPGPANDDGSDDEINGQWGD